ncbi:hypothetical protein Tco_0385723 [Tanacetum coccineum]
MIMMFRPPSRRGALQTHWFTLIVLSALRRSDNENMLSTMNLILMSILTDLKVAPTKPGRMTKPYSSPRFLANFKEFQRSFRHSDTERLSRSDEVLKLKNFKKDATLKLFKSTNQVSIILVKVNLPQDPDLQGLQYLFLLTYIVDIMIIIDCLYYPTCETYGSYDHDTQDHNDIEWFRKGETLQAKNAESFKASKNESPSALRSKTPTKRSITKMDMNSAFFNGFFNEDGLRAQPPGFIDFRKT